MIISKGVGLMRSTYEPGSYSMSISTVRTVTSFFQAGARVLPVSVNQWYESAVGKAACPAGSAVTTGIMAGGGAGGGGLRGLAKKGRSGRERGGRGGGQ